MDFLNDMLEILKLSMTNDMLKSQDNKSENIQTNNNKMIELINKYNNKTLSSDIDLRNLFFNASELVKINNTNNISNISDTKNEKVLLFFYDKNCTRCDCIQIWNLVKNKYISQNFKFYKFLKNSTTNIEKSLNICVYPTIVMINNNNIYNIYNSFSLDNVSKFIETNMK